MPRDPALAALADRWRDARPAERANFQLYITELCEALAVEKPRPAGTGYEFELPVRMVNRDGTESHGRVDLFREGRFLLEAKHAGEATGEAAEVRLRRAFGQAANYAAHVPGGPPPYLMVLDVGRTLRVWDRWSGSYGGFQGVARVIDLTRLADNDDDAEFLRLVWTKPGELNPNAKTEEVTKEIASKLAELAARLEAGGEAGERVARFLIRCVFTMFAEDVGLLKDTPLLTAVQVGMEQRPGDFESAVRRLWAAMDEGGDYGARTLLRFNGHFFHDQDVLPLSRDDLAVLLEAARADWSHVEPSIFGTLLTRALDPEERHRLGAEFTPRAYVERLVRPTIEEPVRERWTMVQAEVLQLRERIREAKDKGARTRATNRALKPLKDFHAWLRSLRILDPACGSGNFLYVSLNILKEIELEVFREIEEITGQKETANLDDVSPAQFHGLEVKLEAEEAARLLRADERHAQIVRPYTNGRDLTKKSRGMFVVDFGTRTQEEAAQFPVLLDFVRDRVKPQRDSNNDPRVRTNWWVFGRNREDLRGALAELQRYLVTPYVSKHRFFRTLPVRVAADGSTVCIASDDSYVLGVLSSAHHVAWALAAGTRIGVGNDSRYNNTACFDSFPFPDGSPASISAVATVAERIEHHRDAALAREDSVTMTGMYNVVEKLHSGESLTQKERKVHEIAACGVLRDLHDELDQLVSDAYGWPAAMGTEEILARLVALHAERVEEERRGLIRWLRPDYQIPRFGDGVEGDLLPDGPPGASEDGAAPGVAVWPDDPLDQLSALRGVLDRPITVDEAARRFKGAGRADIEKHLDALQVLGVVARVEGKWQVRGGAAVGAGAA